MRFNPRPRTGGDLKREGLGDKDIVFQSTPPHGGRLTISDKAARIKGFNPRPRTGGDTKGRNKICPISVSIHAPARGATRPHRGCSGR